MPAKRSDDSVTLYLRVGNERLQELHALLAELHLTSRNAAVVAVWPDMLEAIRRKYSSS